MVSWRFGQKPTERDKEALAKAAVEISRSKMFFQPASDCSIQQIRTNGRHLVAMHGIKVIAIDSMSVLHSDTRQGRDNRVREVAECAEGIKEMAKELDVAIFVIVHIDREKLRNQKPRPRDIRESAQIEQAFDNLWMCYEPDWQEDQPLNLFPRTGLFIPKQRDSEPDCEQFFIFEKPFTRFKEVRMESESQGEMMI